MTEKTIEELTRKIGCLISKVEKRNLIMQNMSNWNKCCAAIDVIEDSQCAIDYYKTTDYPDNYKGKYLFTYGLLQALFIQQDALHSLSSVLYTKFDFRNNYPEIYEIREIRNDTIGHPTNRQDKKCIHIGQIFLEKEKFRYIVYPKAKSIEVDVKKLLIKQEEFTIEILNKIINQLLEEIDNFFKQFEGKNMKEIFNMLTYITGKSYVETHNYIFKDKEDLGFKIIRDMLDKTKTALNERYCDWKENENWQYEIKECEELYKFLTEQIDTINKEKEFIKKHLLSNLLHKLKHLELMAEETDEYFASYGNTRNMPVEENQHMPVIIIDNI